MSSFKDRKSMFSSRLIFFFNILNFFNKSVMKFINLRLGGVELLEKNTSSSIRNKIQVCPTEGLGFTINHSKLQFRPPHRNPSIQLSKGIS